MQDNKATDFIRFNSQRDGILLIPLPKSRGKELFQFPTGWNSTEKLFAFCFIDSSFNSQRDGILPKMRYRNARAFIRFQFPTGWNSTIGLDAQTLKENCFNSQRDGILRSEKKSIGCLVAVSIPNGMEFYSSLSSSSFFCARFNSQRDGILPFGEIGYRLTKSGFNSQRDGISLKILNEKL